MSKHADITAAVLAFVLGAPFAFFMVRAFADAEVTRIETPIRALLGDDVYEAFRAGEKPDHHYFGNELLAPDFELKDKNGHTWRLSDHRGKTVVLNFWTMTCGPCVEEMPSLEELALLTRGRDDIELVAISTDQSWQDVASLFRAEAPLKVLFDPDKAVVRELFGTRMYPETWVIDPRGVVRARVDGARDWSAPIALEFIQAVTSG